MNIRPTQTGYGLETEALRGEVKALRNGQVIAASTRARVMYETRLAPVVYFPPEDICGHLGPLTDLQTFCPFKGTAEYRDLTFEGKTLPNALWSYAKALPESREIEGMVAFMPGIASDMDLGDNVLRPQSDGNISGPMVDWLMREAAFIETPEEFTAAFGRKLRENGVCVSRMMVMIWSLHPLIAGRNYMWTPQDDAVITRTPSYEIYDHPEFLNSPIRHVSAGRGGIRQKLDVDYADNSFPIMDDLRKQGATDYVAMPLIFSNGQWHVLTLTCDHPDGFTTPNLGLIFECSLVVSRYFEVFSQKENAQSLLETYVGKRTGARVLGGEIRRGDGDEIDAAIMFCDMRHSTRLEEELPRADYIELLNHFFETTSTLVQDHGGEVLKFIGDAVLAVFPAGDDAQAACQQAVMAAQEIMTELRKRENCDGSIGIAFGRVTYGNVGSKERLDFTVIGQAANVAARLCDFGKTVRQCITVTEDFTDIGCKTTDLGEIALHNVLAPVRASAVAP